MKSTLLATVLLFLCASSPIPAAAPASTTGTLTGQFLYDGTPPKPARIEIPATSTKVDGITEGTSVDNPYYHNIEIPEESLKVSPNGGVENIFVYVRSKNISAPSVGKSESSEIEFKDGRLSPHTLAFQIPRTLVARNDDPRSIYLAYHAPGSNFLMILPERRRDARTIQDSEEVPAQIIDSTHGWVGAYLLPLKHPYFAITDADGKFKIENLPPGKWEFQTWHERPGYLKVKDWKRGRFAMEIKPGANDLGIIKLDPKQFDPGAGRK